MLDPQIQQLLQQMENEQRNQQQSMINMLLQLGSSGAPATQTLALPANLLSGGQALALNPSFLPALPGLQPGQALALPAGLLNSALLAQPTSQVFAIAPLAAAAAAPAAVPVAAAPAAAAAPTEAAVDPARCTGRRRQRLAAWRGRD